MNAESPDDKTYTLFWRDGNRELVKGRTPAEAMTLAGYGGGAVRALDFYSDGDCNDYTWNAGSREWVTTPAESES